MTGLARGFLVGLNLTNASRRGIDRKHSTMCSLPSPLRLSRRLFIPCQPSTLPSPPSPLPLMATSANRPAGSLALSASNSQNGVEQPLANYDGWDFRHGRRFESEVVRCFWHPRYTTQALLQLALFSSCFHQTVSLPFLDCL
jgi:hypothetical protein